MKIAVTDLISNSYFPAIAAEMIAHVAARDLPYYDVAISEEFVLDMNAFMTDLGWLGGPVAYDSVVATQFKELWAM